MVDAFVGLGSNLGDRAGYLKTAVERLGECSGVELGAISSLYQTDPVGPIEQEKFLNAALHLKTNLSPLDLLDWALRVERECGRTRETRWGPRTLDIDLLLYGDVKLATNELTLPHPALKERAFVLAPLAEICPELQVDGRSVVERRDQIGRQGVDRLIDFDRSERVAIVGASPKPDRYSYRAQKLLMEHGHSVVPVSPREASIMGVRSLASIGDYRGRLDTITLYISPERQTSIANELAKARPKRVIFNPGTESSASARHFEEAGIKIEYACTLVLLQTGQFS